MSYGFTNSIIYVWFQRYCLNISIVVCTQKLRVLDSKDYSSDVCESVRMWLLSCSGCTPPFGGFPFNLSLKAITSTLNMM
jgi:hypothetical protein